MIFIRSVTDIDQGAMLAILQAGEVIPGGQVFQGCCPGFSGSGFGSTQKPITGDFGQPMRELRRTSSRSTSRGIIGRCSA